MIKLTQHKFSDIYKMSSGISSKPEQAGHGSPFVSFKSVFNNYFLPDELPDLMDTTDHEQYIFSVKEGDIFLTRTSETLDELGMSSVAYKEYPKATFSGFLKRLRPLKTGVVYHKYMAFYLRSGLFRKTMKNNAIMTLRASFNEQIFSYLNLMLPPYEEQKRAGDLLFLFHEKIDLNNRINAELEQMAKTLYDYWFVQFDFPDKDGKPYKSSGGKMVYNEVLKREIPEGWDSDIVGSILEKEPKASAKQSNQYNNVGSIPIIDQSRNFICGYTDDEEARISSERPKIVFGDHTRVLKFINFDFARGADGTQVLLSNNNRVPQHYFYHSLLEIEISNYGYARHFKFLKDSRIVIPSLEVVAKFEHQVKRLYDRIKHTIFENINLSSLRDWLLPMLMNGQVKVEDHYPGEQQGELSVAAEPKAAYEKLIP